MKNRSDFEKWHQEHFPENSLMRFCSLSEPYVDKETKARFEMWQLLESRIKELESQLEDAKKDQARYQWLASQYKCVSLDMGGNNAYKLPHFPANIRGLDVNSIIDAAIASIQDNQQ